MGDNMKRPIQTLRIVLEFKQNNEKRCLHSMAYRFIFCNVLYFK